MGNKPQQIALQTNESANEPNSTYKFSQQLKSHHITISSNNRNAKISKSNLTQQLALIDSLYPIKGSIIRFRIPYIGMNLSFGLGVRNIIADDSYHFTKWNQTGHGCYLICNQGRTLSHSHQQYNGRDARKSFYKGHVLRMIVKENELIFANETQNWDWKMPIQLNQNQWQQACFCVVLTGCGDQLQIL